MSPKERDRHHGVMCANCTTSTGSSGGGGGGGIVGARHRCLVSCVSQIICFWLSLYHQIIYIHVNSYIYIFFFSMNSIFFFSLFLIFDKTQVMC